MNPIKMTLGAAVIGVLAFGGLLAVRTPTPNGAEGPSPNPCATPLASPTSPASPAASPVDVSGWVPFTSGRYGYSMCIPAGWTIRNGSEAWTYGGTNEDFGLPGVDQFDSPTDTAAFFVSSMALPDGRSESDWYTDYLARVLPSWPKECWPAEADWQPVQVDGHPGRLHGGLPQCDFTEVAVLVDGRIYDIQGMPNPTTIVYQVFDPALFAAILSTIRFDPAAADDTMPPSAAPSPN